MKCLNCDKEISDKAKYCSDKCRMAFNRKQPEQEGEQQPEQNLPEQGEQPEQMLPEHQPEQIGKDECDYETKVKYGRKYWENPAYLKTASDLMLQTILNVCYKGPDWIGTKAAQEVKARIPYNTSLKTAHLP